MLAFLVLLGLLLSSNAQFFDGFFNIDEPIHRNFVENPIPWEQRLKEVDDRLTLRLTQQVSYLNQRVDELERQVASLHETQHIDWTRSDSGSLYKLFETRKNWDEAQATCRAYKAQLAIIDNAEKNRFVQGLVNETTTEDWAWIGLRTTAAMVTKDSSFSNFSEETQIDGCTVIDHDGVWSIRSCTQLRPFVCQQINVSI